MFLLSQPLTDSIEFEGERYQLDLAFDNVLLVFELLEDDLNIFVQVENALKMLIGEDFDFYENMEKYISLYQAVMENIIVKNSNTNVKRDLAGNPMPEPESKKFYSLTEDAEYIYASFLYDYNIDLFDVQGKLHWDKFNALLISLSEDSKFKQVISIRQRKPDKSMTSEQKRELKEAQEVYALKKNQEELEFESMDWAGKQEYARRQLAAEGGEVYG
ncbi:Gp15 family bacteriophage protein [Listeria seeligeri]